MVNIKNITRQEEDRKLKIKRTKDLANKFFDSAYITNSSTSILIAENKVANHFLYIELINPTRNRMLLFSLEHYKKTLEFIKEYEKMFNVEVTLETDYSK